MDRDVEGRQGLSYSCGGDGVSDTKKNVMFYSRVCFYCLGSLAFLVNIVLEVKALKSSLCHYCCARWVSAMVRML